MSCLIRDRDAIVVRGFCRYVFAVKSNGGSVKKLLISGFAIAFVLGFAGTSFAQTKEEIVGASELLPFIEGYEEACLNVGFKFKRLGDGRELCVKTVPVKTEPQKNILKQITKRKKVCRKWYWSGPNKFCAEY